MDRSNVKIRIYGVSKTHSLDVELNKATKIAKPLRIRNKLPATPNRNSNTNRPRDEAHLGDRFLKATLSKILAS